ncbi:hypothetical protein GCK32_013580 [Trichostrongylus colubriformis]|uniref:Uncharacterized protein n=1 Tax=Trichostrongylus colubriformis TaxID=6319 RepID=A0AAN8FFQ5_TRICO
MAAGAATVAVEGYEHTLKNLCTPVIAIALSRYGRQLWASRTSRPPGQSVQDLAQRAIKELDPTRYHHHPDSGYMSSRFNRLVPQVTSARIVHQARHGEAGRAPGRHVALWVSGSDHIIRVTVVSVHPLSQKRAISVVLLAFRWSHDALCRAIDQHGCDVGGTRAFDVTVRFSKSTAAADPVYDQSPGPRSLPALVPVLRQILSSTFFTVATL